MEARIREIRVEGLFGMFDHIIPLNLDKRITIIYGENGIGNTMIFRILYAFLHKQFDTLFKLPFISFKIIFEDNSWLSVSKDSDLLFESSKSEPSVFRLATRGKWDLRTIEKFYEKNQELLLSELLEHYSKLDNPIRRLNL